MCLLIHLLWIYICKDIIDIEMLSRVKCDLAAEKVPQQKLGNGTIGKNGPQQA